MEKNRQPSYFTNTYFTAKIRDDEENLWNSTSPTLDFKIIISPKIQHQLASSQTDVEKLQNRISVK